MFTAGQHSPPPPPHHHPRPGPSQRFHQGLQAPGEGAELGIFKALSVRPEQEREPRLPSGPNAPQVTLERGCMRKLPAGQPPSQPSPGDHRPPSFLPQRTNVRSSWVSGESRNKGKESHFLLRGRKEAEIQPPTQPALGCSPAQGQGWLTRRASRDGGIPPPGSLSLVLLLPNPLGPPLSCALQDSEKVAEARLGVKLQAVGVKLSPSPGPAGDLAAWDRRASPTLPPQGSGGGAHRAEFIPNPTSFLLGHPKEVTEPLWASVISKSGNEVFLEGWLRG